MEQMRMYEALVGQSQEQLLEHKSFHQPLLALLHSCMGQAFSLEVEKQLVVLLNQLCVCMVQHSQLLKLFFQEAKDNQPSRFTIFSLLIHFVHREGALGQQARDALLLCMVLSKTHQQMASFIAHQSTVCPVLATGLSGLYSALPRRLPSATLSDDWHRFTPDDVNELPELVIFMNNLEFCNAVVQVAHADIRNQLLEYLYQGFLVPVMGPALLQSTEEELIAATAYFDLFLRSLSEPGLLRSFLYFTLRNTYDGQRIIDSLVDRIKATSRLCLVSLALLETLVDLNCEDVMVELVLRHLVPCSHMMLSQRSRVKHVDTYCHTAQVLLSLTPAVPNRHDSSEGSLYGDYQAYLLDARSKIINCALATACWRFPYDGENPPHSGLPVRSVELAVSQSQESEADHSLPSADDGSSGYESFALKDTGRGSDSGGDCDSPCGSGSEIEVRNESPPGAREREHTFNATPSIGLFLDALLVKLEGMLSLDLFTILRLTGLISRLALYPQPLLHSTLLDASLVFQPSVRNLFQVLGILKTRIEAALTRDAKELDTLVRETQCYLLDREERLVNARKHALEAPASLPAATLSPEPFDRADNKRRSLTMAISSVFRRSGSPLPRTAQTYRFKSGGDNGSSKQAVMCAVILDEWLKELSAISQEHMILKTS